jgi:prophage antirepressor-like protein
MPNYETMPFVHSDTNGGLICSGIATPSVFQRHDRSLRAVVLETQVWFCARDLGRMMGIHLDARALRKLEPDQTRTIPLDQHGSIEQTLMLSESGMYRMIHNHFHPENRNLRYWLSCEVIPALRDSQLPLRVEAPAMGYLSWPGMQLCTLFWQSEPWIRLRDMPQASHKEASAEHGTGRLVERRTFQRLWRTLLRIRRG